MPLAPSIFVAGSLDIYSQLRLLESPLSQDVNDKINSINDGNCAQPVREFKERIDSIMLAYEPLVEKITRAAESEDRKFSSFSSKDASKAEAMANALYAWAGTFVPREYDGLVSLNKNAKLALLPYLVAMAYAVRVKLDAHYVESSFVVKKERVEFLERSRGTVRKFLFLARMVLNSILESSSLLEVALEYHLALTTYVALTVTLRKSLQLMLEPCDTPNGALRTAQAWDDGLSGIRYSNLRSGR